MVIIVIFENLHFTR